MKKVMKTDRNYILDFLKGGLVIAMIVHHSLDYFGRDLTFLYKYVRFVTGSFLFISGFIISNVLLKKYGDQYKTMSIRTIIRGVRLVLIFTILNILIIYFIKKDDWLINPVASIFKENIYSIFISGNYRLVAFEILLPIGYLMTGLGIAVLILKKRHWIINYIFALLFIYCSVNFFLMDGAYNLRYLTVGLCGFAFGYIPLNKYQSALSYFWAVVIVYIVHLGLLNISRVNFLVYNITVLANLAIIFSIGLKFNPEKIFTKKMILLGRYTLYSYIGQILILQILARLLSPFHLPPHPIFLGFILATILTYLSVELMVYLRRKSELMNKIYKAVFQ